MRNMEIALGVFVILSFFAGAYFYTILPAIVPSHWDALGRVNGYMDSFWGAFMLPFISAGMYFLFLLVPRIDPLKKNVRSFIKYFDMFICALFIFLAYIYALTLAWAFGHTFNMVQALVPAMALLYYCMGVLCENAKLNWFIGIRTPWTMSSKRVWESTNRLGGKLFKACAVIALLGLVFADYAFVFVLVPVLFAAFFTVAFSYYEYKGGKKKRR